MTLLGLLEALHADGERVRSETKTCRPKSAGGTKFNSSRQWPSIEDHHIEFGSSSPHLAEETGSSY